MSNLTQPGYFRQIFEVYLDMGLSYHQAALINYIHRWNDQGQKCFAAVECIAADLRLPLRTMRRVIDRSITDNVISGSSSGKGRARVLEVTQSFLARVEVQLANQVAKVDTCQASAPPEVAIMDTSSGQSVTPSGHFVTASGQSGHLSRSISKPIPKSIDLEPVSNSSDPATTGLDFYKNLGLIKTGKPTPAKPQRHSESAEEKAAFLQFKKDLLSKTKTSIAEYDDIPE